MGKKVDISPVSGFPEWLPGVRMEEQRLIDVIRREYECYGFAPIETPAVERLDVLLSKGGMQKQIYSLGKPEEGDVAEKLGLHFDLTVPLARYVVQHSNELAFPFRRYQIQKVWRGEKAQKGRFREFYQCDIDIIGRESLDVIQDAEIVAVINSTLQSIRTATGNALPNYKIHLNNRKILSSLLSSFDIDRESVVNVLRILDKMKRDGKENTETLLSGEGIGKKAIAAILELVCCTGLEEAKCVLSNCEAAVVGISEMNIVVESAKLLGVPEETMVLEFGITRGLDYYTGTVYETFIDGLEGWGSVCSGGRYDDLAAYFSRHQFPGVGVSIGLSRLFGLMLESNMLDTSCETPTKVLVVTPPDGRDKYLTDCLSIAGNLRKSGINTEVFLNRTDLGSQIKYASNKGIRLVIIAAGNELSEDAVIIKDLLLRTQELITCENIVGYINGRLLNQ